MVEMLAVQKGVPMPGIKRPGAARRRKYPIETMAVGDMFFEPGRSSRALSAYICRIAKGLPAKFSTRRCFMRKVRVGDVWKWKECAPTDGDAVEGAGVWRTE